MRTSEKRVLARELEETNDALREANLRLASLINLRLRERNEQ